MYLDEIESKGKLAEEEDEANGVETVYQIIPVTDEMLRAVDSDTEV